jgi:ATP-dependent RNA helicase DDX51/DBP6
MTEDYLIDLRWNAVSDEKDTEGLSVDRFSELPLEKEQNADSEDALAAEDTNGNNDKTTREPTIFTVVGQQQAPTARKIKVVSQLVASATSFPAEITENTLSDLTEIEHVDPLIRKAVETKIQSWFPVQKATLPYLLDHSTVLPPRDIVICAPTGSGKTMCFVIPVLNLLKKTRNGSLCALVVVPVQNLAKQIETEFQKFNVYGANIVLLNAASDYGTERKRLFPNKSRRSQANVIIATPGRLVEHLVDLTGHIDLSSLRFLIVDEADRMGQTARLEWLALVERMASVKTSTTLSIGDIMNSDQNRWLQKILVSATMTTDLERLHIWHLRCPRLFRADARKATEIVQPSENIRHSHGPSLPSTIHHEVMTCAPSVKPLALYTYIAKHPQWKKVIVFANQKMSSFRLAQLFQLLCNDKFEVAELSANLFGKRRQKVLKRFVQGQTRVLISSDVMSRGMDVTDIDCVVNYDVPLNQTIFIHRAGRTARAGRSGFLLSLTTKEERLTLKKALCQGGLWQNIHENRDDAKKFSEEFEQEYSIALNKLQEKIEKKTEVPVQPQRPKRRR